MVAYKRRKIFKKPHKKAVNNISYLTSYFSESRHDFANQIHNFIVVSIPNHLKSNILFLYELDMETSTVREQNFPGKSFDSFNHIEAQHPFS